MKFGVSQVQLFHHEASQVDSCSFGPVLTGVFLLSRMKRGQSQLEAISSTCKNRSSTQQTQVM